MTDRKPSQQILQRGSPSDVRCLTRPRSWKGTLGPAAAARACALVPTLCTAPSDSRRLMFSRRYEVNDPTAAYYASHSRA
ncbi:hypothetical protein CCHR01_05324 [Colletotrichum chrysophilum]|uniref:Uncharacterized protein n=1 Tax=Colletotrichum chrysophilum TaxID=1836956 RepID=A0AAD9ARE0_9PEZI|nr:hypothetical protein CCHR01_05324 [Colletotrichum chrysophilum]